MSEPLDIVIPAAAPGRRMRSLGPRALLRVGDETILGRQVRMLADAYPYAHLTVVVGFEADRVVRTLPKNVRVVHNLDYETSGAARSLALGLAGGEGPALLVYGDLVFTPEAVGGLGGVTTAVGDLSAAREQEVGMTVDRGRVMRFSYGLPLRWAQLAFLSGPDRAAFAREAALPARRLHLAHEVFNHLLDRGMDMRTEVRGRVVEVDAAADLDRARRLD